MHLSFLPYILLNVFLVSINIYIYKVSAEKMDALVYSTIFFFCFDTVCVSHMLVEHVWVV